MILVALLDAEATRRGEVDASPHAGRGSSSTRDETRRDQGRLPFRRGETRRTERSTSRGVRREEGEARQRLQLCSNTKKDTISMASSSSSPSSSQAPQQSLGQLASSSPALSIIVNTAVLSASAGLLGSTVGVLRQDPQRPPVVLATRALVNAASAGFPFFGEAD